MYNIITYFTVEPVLDFAKLYYYGDSVYSFVIES